MRQTCMQRDRATTRFATSLGYHDKHSQWNLADVPDLAKRRASTSLRRLKMMAETARTSGHGCCARLPTIIPAQPWKFMDPAQDLVILQAVV